MKTTTRWSVTSRECRDVTPLGGGVTTRGQLGALAAGATIARCGAGSAIFRVMGLDHATSFVRMLWEEVVRPTIRVFALGLMVLPHDPTDARRLTLYFSFSPLLMSLSSSPGRVTTTPMDFSNVFEGLPPPRPELPDYGMRDFNTKWVVCIETRPRFLETNIPPTTTTHSSSTNSNRISDGIARMSVAPLKGGIGGGIIGGDGATCDVDRAVVVDVPVVAGCVALRVYMDQSVDREVVVAQVTDSCVVMLAVDMEETCNSKKLAVLSTTRCDFPSVVGYGFYSAVVMRNWDDPFSPSYGSRTFLVKVSWQQSRNELLKFVEGGTREVVQYEHGEDVFRLSDSLFCVSCSTKKLVGSLRIYHRDNTAHALNLISGSKCKLKSRKQFYMEIESGFIFKVFPNLIEVIEPTLGSVVLTINFPEVSRLSLHTPLSDCDKKNLQPRITWLQYLAVGFLYNVSAWQWWVSLPILADQLSATAFELGILETCTCLSYAIASPAVSSLVLKLAPSVVVVRIGIGLFLLACVCISLLLKSVWNLYIFAALVAAAEGFFWPVVNLAVGEEAPAGRMEREVLYFCISWGVAKTVGFLFGGTLAGQLSERALIPVACLLAVVLFIFPWRPWIRQKQRDKTGEMEMSILPPETPMEIPVPAPEEVMTKASEIHSETEETGNAEPARAPPLSWGRSILNAITYPVDPRININTVYIPLTWTFSFTTYGVMGCIHNQYILLINERQIGFDIFNLNPGPLYLGIYMAVSAASQTITFFLFSFTTRWKHSRVLIYLFQLGVIAGLIGISFLSNRWVILLTAILIGAAAGFSIMSGVVYSLQASDSLKGLLVGLSESVLTGGGFIMPLVGGAVSTSTGDLRVSYWVSAAVVAATLVAQEFLYRFMVVIMRRRKQAQDRHSSAH
ncbi:major facilitator superfamily protein [Pelomyxa schiedti]|nr:major facilitator superfamily protein [Pelomyxa schiedti]